IVGYYFDSVGASYGFVDNNGSFTTIIDPLAVGGKIGSGTVVNGINDNGDIVGSYYDAAGVRHGFLDRAGNFTTIDYPGVNYSYLTGINNAGDIVGAYVDSGNVS